MKQNKEDFNTSRALKMLVGKRRRLLDYLMKVDIEHYRSIFVWHILKFWGQLISGR